MFSVATILTVATVAGDARAEFDQGTTVERISPGGRYNGIYRVQKGDKVWIAVSSGGKADILCAVRDQDKDIFVADGGDSCTLLFTASYSGKYYLGVLNQGSTEAAVVVTAGW